MLERLEIKNFAIIENVAIDFKEGFTVISGETGAGKSIIVEALSLLMGKRANSSSVRAGSSELVIQAVYRINNSNSDIEMKNLLAGHLDDEEIILSRVISANGRSRSYLNGAIVPIQLISSIGKYLFSIHSQHENQLILDAKNHIKYLEDFAGEQMNDIKYKFSDSFAKLKNQTKELSRLEQEISSINNQKDFFKFQIEEISRAQLKPGELDELRQTSRRISNSERLIKNLSEAYEVLKKGEFNVIDSLAEVSKLLGQISGIDEQNTQMKESAETALLRIDELSRDIMSYMQKLDYSQIEHENIEARISQISDLLRKYGGTEEDAINYLREIEKKIDLLNGSDINLSKLKTEMANTKGQIEATGRELSGKRRAASKVFNSNVTAELSELNMEKALFEVKIETTQEPSELGYDRVEFMISPNPGEGMHPLKSIASGGELSRVMLAVKGVLKKAMPSDVSIFDEVDAGVGGKTAMSIGKKLSELAANGQVICITHLPQISAFADNHLKIEKSEKNNRTSVEIHEIENDEKIIELARMMGSDETDISKAHAKELVEHASKEKLVKK